VQPAELRPVAKSDLRRRCPHPAPLSPARATGIDPIEAVTVFPDRRRRCQNGRVGGKDGPASATVDETGTTMTAVTAGRAPAGSGAMTAPAPEKTEIVDPVTAADVPWVTIVWNDPVNLMSYVTLVFQKLLGHPRPKAEALMLDVHHKGRATVSAGPREKMEADVAKLQGAGLWATMARDS
jgi:ATP-dependent Clp protease adaptor protein ClpS